MEEEHVYSKVELDIEWLQLILEAKNIGIKKEEIRQFLLNDKEMFAKRALTE